MTKSQNFASDGIKVQMSSKDLKIMEMCFPRDLFGRLVYLATQQLISMEAILAYPLTPAPLSMAHINGAMCTTNKAAFCKKLEKNVQIPDYIQPQVALIDFMFFIRCRKDLPPTFGGIARAILHTACQFAEEVHIICDTYTNEPSIKDYTRQIRGASDRTYHISGPAQRRPADFSKALQSKSFKTSFINFLAVEWSSSNYVNIIDGHTLYYAFENKCQQYQVTEGILETKLISELECCHEEADTRLVYHARHVACKTQEPTTAIVRTDDTDILVLFLYHISNTLAHHVKFYLDMGLDGKNNRHLVDVSSLATTLGSDVCTALPSYHAFTGCDYTAAFSRKGKSRPFDLMLKNRQYLESLSMLGKRDRVTQSTLVGLEKYVCAMYGEPKSSRVNDAWFFLLKKIQSPGSHRTHPLQKLKSADSARLPPCASELHQKIL